MKRLGNEDCSKIAKFWAKTTSHGHRSTLNDDSDILKKVITGDESWVYDYDIKTKAQSSRFATTEEMKENRKTKQELCCDTKHAHFRSVSRIGKNAGISVFYLSGVNLKRTR